MQLFAHGGFVQVQQMSCRDGGGVLEIRCDRDDEEDADVMQTSCVLSVNPGQTGFGRDACLVRDLIRLKRAHMHTRMRLEYAHASGFPQFHVLCVRVRKAR